MSGQWEVVGKKKDKSGKQAPQKISAAAVGSSGNNNNNNKKKAIANGPKAEDILPESQLKNLYASNNKGVREAQKPQDKTLKKQENNGKQKKADRPPQQQQQETAKSKPPKSIESALNSIVIEDFAKDFEETKARFPNAPIVWLKQMVAFLNQWVPVDVQDPVFSCKGECYPFSAIPTPIKSLMEKAVKEAGGENAQFFYDVCLTAMATDMGKGLPALGHKFFIQLLALNNPKIVTANLAKHIVLRSSYQNRQAIGLSILWGLGQGGIKNFHVGLKVFQDVMLPLLEMKNYSRYVVTYLVDLTNRFNDVPLTKEQYLLIMEIIYMSKKNFPLDQTNSLHNIVPKLKVLLFTSNNDKYYSFVEPVLRELNGFGAREPFAGDLCDVLVTCLQKDQASFGAWSKSYTKYLPASAALLNYIEKNWSSLFKKLNRKMLGDLLKTFAATNEELTITRMLLKKKKDDGVPEVVAAVKKLTNRMATKKSSGFSLKLMAFMLAFAGGAIVCYDINRHGSWQTSKTFQLLKDSGVCEYTHKAAARAKEGVFWAQQRFDDSFPGYSEKVVEFAEPYVQLTRDLSLVFYNMFSNLREVIISKYPAFVESVETYAPGFIEQSQKTFQDVWSASLFYYNRSVDYLKEEVFVGQLAPENMHRVVMDALNTTQQKASEYYLWLYEKVQRTIK